MANPYFKEDDQLVYVIWYDDGEPYENFSCIEHIFSSWEEAEKWLTFCNDCIKYEEKVWKYVLNPGSWYVLTPRWKKRNPLDLYPNETWDIEIWNLNTGKEVPFDDKHIFLIDNPANNSMLETLESRQ